jgi:2-isopropylmalate synthase
MTILRIMMGDEIFKESTHYHLNYMQVNSGTNSIPTATVSIKYNGEELSDSATGDGPVDALFNAIDRALTTKYKIESYRVRSVTSGRQALR